jgi:hypothetical protein
MKKMNQLPQKSTVMIGAYKTKLQRADDTSATTDSTTTLSLSTTHLFNI